MCGWMAKALYVMCTDYSLEKNLVGYCTAKTHGRIIDNGGKEAG